MKVLSASDNLLLYGAGEVGQKTAKILSNAGYHIAGFLDQKKTGTIDGYKLFKPDEIDKPFEFTVVICLANGNIHKEVAQKLFIIGYQYLVCLPLGFEIDDALKRKITRNYNDVIEGQKKTLYAIEKADLTYDVLIHQKDILENWMPEEKRVFWIQKEIVFSESKEKYPGDVTRLPDDESLYDRPVSLRKPYYVLYDYFSGQNDNVDEYFNIYKTTIGEVEKKRILKERIELYKVMKQELAKSNFSYFEQGAPEVEWNNGGYFNLVGGHHRTTFLIHEGFRCVPVRVNKNDYLQWINLEYLRENKEVLFDRKESFTIPNPAFQTRYSANIDKEEAVYDCVMAVLDENKGVNNSLLDISEWSGLFALAAHRLHFDTVAMYACDEEYEKALLSLLRGARIDVCKGVDEQYDFVVDLENDVQKVIRKIDTDSVFEMCKRFYISNRISDEYGQELLKIGKIESIDVIGKYKINDESRKIFLLKKAE